MDRPFQRAFLLPQVGLKVPIYERNPEQAKDMALRKHLQQLTGFKTAFAFFTTHKGSFSLVLHSGGTEP